MKNKLLLLPTLFAVATTVITGCASTRNQPAAEWDGLVLRPNTRLNAVWVRPNIELVAYRSVMIDPVSVSFASNWDPNSGQRSPSRRLDASDVAAIQTSLGVKVREGFRAELERGGYQIVDQPGDETLRITAAIVNLDVTAPDTMSAGRSRTYTANSGSMTLVLELRDSVSGELLARAADRQSGRNTGMMTITNRVTNTGDARRAIGVWATALRRGLDEFYGKATAAS